MPNRVTNALSKLLRGDISPIRRKLWAMRHARRREREYDLWVAEYGSLTSERRGELLREAEAMSGPLISIVMPVYNVEERWLREAIESVLAQIYRNWELCIADDASPAPHIRPILEEFASRDSRIKVAFRERNGNISAASNTALELASGDLIALMDHDDRLAEDALFQVARTINRFPETDLIYTDEDKIDTEGRRFYPMIKPDWSPEMMRSINMITHLCVFRASVMREIGGFREGVEGSQDYDLSLRYIERVKPENIRHIPRVLYHWRAIRGSVAFGTGEKTYAHDRARTALSEHFQRTGIAAGVVRGVGEMHRALYPLPEGTRISVICDAARVAPLLRTAGVTEVETVDIGGGAGFAELNRAASKASGEVLVFVSPALCDAAYGWADELAARALLAGVGVAGGKIADVHGRILHAGYFLGVAGGIARAHYGYPADYHGEFVRLAVDQNFSAVSADLMAVRRDLFLQVGGFDAASFPQAGADIDLCIRLAESGQRTVWTPWASITAHSARPVPDGDELEQLRKRWPRAFACDPFYNPNLTREREDLSFAFPPASVD